jgi:hypothetical protein
LIIAQGFVGGKREGFPDIATEGEAGFIGESITGDAVGTGEIKIDFVFFIIETGLRFFVGGARRTERSYNDIRPNSGLSNQGLDFGRG